MVGQQCLPDCPARVPIQLRVGDGEVDAGGNGGVEGVGAVGCEEDEG